MINIIDLQIGKILTVMSAENIIIKENIIWIIDKFENLYVLNNHYELYKNWAINIKKYPNTFPHKIEFSYKNNGAPCAHIESIVIPLKLYYKIVNEYGKKIKYPLDILSNKNLIKRSRAVLIYAQYLVTKYRSRKILRKRNMNIYLDYINSIVGAYDNKFLI